MTSRTPTYLKSRFEDGDTPQQADYADVFDSFLPFTVTGKQTLDISLEITGDFTASGNIYGSNVFTNNVNAQLVSASVVNSNIINAQLVSASVVNSNIINAQLVSASSSNIKYSRGSVDSSVAATGITTAAAKSVSESISVIKAVTSGSNDAVIISRSRPGFVQLIINDASASARVFPTSGAKFNQLANGASFDIPDRRTCAVYHITSAQYYTATLTR